jgi:gamma-glutamyl-gamma-aminobutyrate hydrolase PuuD
MKRPKIHVVGRDYSYEQMFIKNGWVPVDNPEDADAIQFTGGADVDPMLYNEPKHPRTGTNPMRDSAEAHIFYTYENEKPMLGICRGGQFLCVMSGGRLWQDVDMHGISGVHAAVDIDTQQVVMVSSTHHQMMDPTTAENYSILVTSGRTTRKSDGWGNDIKQDKDVHDRDVEAVFFEDTQCLCFQPHPEFFDPSHECQRLYFDLIKRHLKLGV